MVGVLAADAELVSPLSGPDGVPGRDDLRVLLDAVYGGLSNLIWREVIGDGSTRVAVSEARIAGVTITDAMVLELDDAGLIGGSGLICARGWRSRCSLCSWVPRSPVTPAFCVALCDADTEPAVQRGVPGRD